MKPEIPEFKRCFCCIPLRQGLLTLGYIKLVTSLPLILLSIFGIHIFLFFNSKLQILSTINDEFTLPIISIVIILLDVIFTLVFLVGGHLKSTKVLRVYYLYSIIMLCLTTILVIVLNGIHLREYVNFISLYKKDHLFVFSCLAIISAVAGSFTYVGFQGYFILLIRSEINKLRNSNSYNFRFSNNITEQLDTGIKEVTPTA